MSWSLIWQAIVTMPLDNWLWLALFIFMACVLSGLSGWHCQRVELMRQARKRRER